MRRKYGFKKKDKPTNSLGFEKRDFDYGSPSKEKMTEKSLLYNAKAFRDLQNVGNIEPKVDPNGEISKGGYPYPIIAATNKVMDANYAGYDNIEGNILTRLQNSTRSKLYNYFDVITANLRLNYLYLCYETNSTNKHNNVAVNREMTKAFAEALSKTYSTMTTQLPYYLDKIEAVDAPSIGGTDTDAALYGKMMGLLHYQTVLQNAVSPLSKYIETMSLYQHVLDMSYRRESAIINALFGLLKKKAFIATLNSIGTSIIGEYFDDNWYKQINLLAFTPSRKSFSVVDPLETASVTTYIPDVKFSYPVTTESGTEYELYYQYSDISHGGLKIQGKFINPDTFQIEGTTGEPITLNFEEVIYRLNRMLDVSTILEWARKFNTRPADVGDVSSPSAYYQQINLLVEAANTLLSRFTSNMTDVRTFLDKLNDSGMVYWKKGLTISIDKVETFNPTYNVVLHNVIAAYCGGSASMTFDANTQRWQANTLWNKYEGIPEFDRKSGGAFLTFGLRYIIQGDIANTDTAMCLPIMFATELNQGSSKVQIINRKGLTLTVETYRTIDGITLNPSLARLDPLDVGFDIKIPYVDATNLSTTLERPSLKAAILHILTNLCSYGGYYDEDETDPGGVIGVDQTTLVVGVDPDVVCFLDLQVEDVSNEMIQFCRNYSPFRVMTPDGKRTMGFAAVSKSSK